MSINSREDANRYYRLVNELVDDYMSKGKIRPSNLKRYLEPGSDRFKKFLIRNELNEINGIDRVLSDVIEDRVNMESDGVLTFENFKFFESDEFKIKSLIQCLYKGIEKADLKMEKVLADVFDTNLGSIDVVDSDKHLFNLEDEMVNLVCFSDEDIKIIENNVVEYLFTQLRKKEVELLDMMEGDLSINLGDFISNNEAVFKAFDESIRKKLDDGKLDLMIENLISNEYQANKVVVKSEKGYTFWYWN